MSSEPAAPMPGSSLDVARSRDARICWLLDMHPVTAGLLVSLGWFPSKPKARKRLRRLAARKRIRLIGTVCRRATGRPEHVYCRYRSKPDQLLHEVELTELCCRVAASSILRGPHVRDAEIRPDAELRINGVTYYLELDRGTMGYAQIARRFRTYERCPHLSLWVCSTLKRMEELRRRAEGLRHTALFTTVAEALAGPHRSIWRDFRGQTAALPRERAGP